MEAADRPAGAGFFDLVIRSPGHDQEDLKDQDRARWWVDTGTAVVCDGTTSSPYAEEAAEYVVDRAPTLFGPGRDSLEQTIATIAAELLQRREVALQRPVQLPAGLPEAVLQVMRETVTANRRRSLQTTAVAARIQRDGDEVRVQYYRCGDSELFVFGPRGDVVFTTYPIAARPPTDTEGDILFWDRPSATPVLPDSFEIYVAGDRRFPLGISLLLATDGLFEAFTGSRELYNWLVRHKHPLKQGGEVQQALCNDLHAKLTRGDDDISLIWVETGDPGGGPPAPGIAGT